jgi:hypothetical protein
MLDLEERLREDRSGSFKNELITQLQAEERAVSGRVIRGLPPSEFHQATTWAAAIRAANLIVEKTWKAIHQPKTNNK